MICAACGSGTPVDPCAACGAAARLAGRYALLSVLGSGASGVMWLAEGADGARVAIKELRVTADPKATELIAREARVLRELAHPQIPTYVEDFGLGAGRHRLHYVVQEVIEGRTLAAVLAERRVELDEAIGWIEQLLVPLAYLHALGPPVVHRDLKPENVIVQPDGTLAIVDFGSVRDAWKGTLGGSTVAGTFAYMAPEQFAGDASPASDVYALGVLLVEILSRRDPQTLRDRLQRFHWRAAIEVPERYAELLASMLADEPSERPRDAEALRIALAHARAGGVAAPLDGDEVPLFEVDQRRFVGAVVVAVGLAVGLGTIVVASANAAPTEEQGRAAAVAHAAVWSDPDVMACVGVDDAVSGRIEISADRPWAFRPGRDVSPFTRSCLNRAFGGLGPPFVEPGSVGIGLPWSTTTVNGPPDGVRVTRTARSRFAADADAANVELELQWHGAAYVDGADFAALLENTGTHVLDAVPHGTYRTATRHPWGAWTSPPEDSVTITGRRCMFRWGGKRWTGVCVD